MSGPTYAPSAGKRIAGARSWTARPKSVAFASGSQRGVSAALFYTLAYTVTNLGAFAIVTILSRSEDKLTSISDYAGLAAKRPQFMEDLRRPRSAALLLAATGRIYVGHVGEEELPHRERLQRLVAEDADVQLAALDVVLDDGCGADALVDERDALLQLLVAVDD